MIHKIVTSLHKYGLKKTVQRIVRSIKIYISLTRDYWFDLKYGTDTKTFVPLESLRIDSHNKTCGVEYQPTRAIPFRKLIRMVNLPFVPKDIVFVDLGSGKGRALLLAAEFDFKRIVGIEFSPELCDIARKNVSIYQKKTGNTVPIEIIADDVMNYKFINNENFVYMANPFNSDILMNQVLNNIRDSYFNNPRDIILVYYNPVLRDIIEKHENFRKREEYFLGGSTYVIYSFVEKV